MIVTKNFKEKASGLNELAPIKPSPIIIDEAVLFNAAEAPVLDEAVIGKFLNIYEPLLNEDYLRRVEITYKKRIMAEKLIEIQADYGDLSSNLILPYEYFLFDKLHKLALQQPDLIDIYQRTYCGGLRGECLAFGLRGFREAAEFLASHGIIISGDDSVRILKERKQRKNALHKLNQLNPLTTAGAIKNAFRTLASIAGIEYKAKPLAGLKFNEKGESTVELDRPNKLLRLEEGVVFDDPSRMIEEVALIHGFTGTYTHEEVKKGGIINSSTLLKISGEGRDAKFILKHFPELKNVKWIILNVWTFAAKRFNMTPLSRLSREVEAVRKLHGIGIKTHRITGVVLDERTLVSEYTEGVPLDKSVEEIAGGKSTDTGDIERYAQVLGKMHKVGLVYGDTKPANALVGDDGIYLNDLEQAVERGDQAWDLAEFLYYSAMLAKEVEGMRLVARSFLTAYRSENGGRNIARARKLRYLLPFLLVMAPKMMRAVREELAREAHPARNDLTAP